MSGVSKEIKFGFAAGLEIYIDDVDPYHFQFDGTFMNTNYSISMPTTTTCKWVIPVKVWQKGNLCRNLTLVIHAVHRPINE